MLKNTFSCLIIFILILPGCEKSGLTNTDECSTVAAKFSADVWPIINTSCVKCHGVNSTNSGGSLAEYNHIYLKRESIKFQIETNQMPKSTSLTIEQKNKITCWINSGAPNN